MESKKKDFVARNPKIAWETIQELILDDENMALNDLDEELKACGIDPDDALKRLFEIAQSVSRESQAGGRVSKHVSDVLSQLASKYYQLESDAATDTGMQRSRREGSHSNSRRSQTEIKTGRAKVLNYHRNYKDESASDRTIRERNEERLREKAEKLKKKISRKK